MMPMSVISRTRPRRTRNARRYRGVRDRYPMHIFREAMEGFDEPYSPLEFVTAPDFVEEVFESGEELWRHKGGIHLDIREFDPANAAHRHDWNRCIELAEKILHHLIRTPDDATRLFANFRFPSLSYLYASRRHKTSSTWQQAPSSSDDGNGNHPADWMFDREPPQPGDTA